MSPTPLGGQAGQGRDGTDDLLRKGAVTEALGAISVAHREVLNETILRGRTVNQAAEAMGIPVATVKSRVYYALRALRLVMAERGLCFLATARKHSEEPCR